MIVGSVKELKKYENRVGLMPSHAREYIKAGHEVFVEAGLGIGSGFSDEEYKEAGAVVLKTAKEVWEKSKMIIKVKEPLEEEYERMKRDQIIFTYFHLARDEALAKVMLEKHISAMAYETVRDKDGNLPLLKPMSEVAGRLSIQQGSKYLEMTYGGKGILLSGVPGVKSGHVTIIGGGVVGMSACKTALGTGATVTVLDRDLERLAYIEDVFNGQVETLYSDDKSIEDELKKADVVVGSVLLPGDKAPKLVRKEHLKLMEKGTVLVDVAIDQGGCFETSRPSTHKDPIYIVDGIVHYSVTNMPGAVPQTATVALANATLPYGLRIANMGLEKAIEADHDFKQGLNCYKGHVTNQAVARALNFDYTEYENCIKTMQV